jgi:transcriptional regulator with XRE-family HTH domain
MGRKSRYQEFLITLSQVTGLSGAAFAKACGKQNSNMSQYLKGTKQPGLNTLKSALTHLRDHWPVKAILEAEPIPKPLTKLPKAPGIYALYSSSGDVLYVGQAKNLRTEVNQTLNRKVNFAVRRGPQITKKARPKYKELAAMMSAYTVDSKRLKHNLEAILLRVFLNDAHNNKMGTFK